MTPEDEAEYAHQQEWQSCRETLATADARNAAVRAEDEAVEAVARAIHDAHPQTYYAQARAAISAYREWLVQRDFLITTVGREAVDD